MPFLLGLLLFADWLTFEGKGKHIVLVSGDDEYRSEQAMPQLARILSTHHGFKTTALFALDVNGVVNPERKDNIPGLQALQTADLMILFTRFRDLPDEQMKFIVDYVQSGKPVVGIRTATHAFDIKPGKTIRTGVGTARIGMAALDARCLAKPGSRIRQAQGPKYARALGFRPGEALDFEGCS